MAKHAVLSASSSERWLNCPPSARLCEAYEDKGSDYAAEGTDAHTLCEYRLKQALGIPAEDSDIAGLLNALSAATGTEIPAPLASVLTKEVRFTDVVKPADMAKVPFEH